MYSQMYRISIRVLLVLSVFLVISCATSMTPSQFNNKFPESTNSEFYDKGAASEAISKGECKLLTEGRKYTAPIGMTVNGDVNNGAKGVDEWVKADGGNAYAINNYEWISVGDRGATQLIVYFDTLICK